MARIARAAGVTPTTIYWYVDDKDALLVAALDHLLAAALQQFDQQAGAPLVDQVMWALRAARGPPHPDQRRACPQRAVRSRCHLARRFPRADGQPRHRPPHHARRTRAGPISDGQAHHLCGRGPPVASHQRCRDPCRSRPRPLAAGPRHPTAGAALTPERVIGPHERRVLRPSRHVCERLDLTRRRRGDAPPVRADCPRGDVSPGTNSGRHRDPARRRTRSGRRTTGLSQRCSRSHPTRESASRLAGVAELPRHRGRCLCAVPRAGYQRR